MRDRRWAFPFVFILEIFSCLCLPGFMMRNAFAQNPILRVPMSQFTPGQGDVSFRRVEQRKPRIQERLEKGTLDRYLEEKVVPFILGPGDERRARDRTHLKRTLRELDLEELELPANQVADYSW